LFAKTIKPEMAHKQILIDILARWARNFKQLIVTFG